MEAFNQGILLAVGSMKDQIHELASDHILIGNGLINYDFNAGNGNPLYEDFVDLLDGFCMEHVMGFEVSINLLIYMNYKFVGCQYAS